MAAALPWFALFPGDWMTETARFSVVARAAHVDLICAVWSGGPIPNDDAMLSRCARLSEGEWTQVRRELLTVWKIGERGWTLDWIEAQRARAVDRSEKARAAINSRWERERANTHEDTSVSTTEDTDVVHPSPSPSPSINPSGVVLGRERPTDRRAKGGFAVRKGNAVSQRIFEIGEAMSSGEAGAEAAKALTDAMEAALDGYRVSPNDQRDIEGMLGGDPADNARLAVAALEKLTATNSKTPRITSPVAWVKAAILNQQRKPAGPQGALDVPF